MQELHVSLRLELTDDPQLAAQTLAAVAAAWANMLKQVGAEGVEASLTINETKARPKGPRRPRLLPPEGVAA